MTAIEKVRNSLFPEEEARNVKREENHYPSLKPSVGFIFIITGSHGKPNVSP
jgi:hypothetical protein